MDNIVTPGPHGDKGDYGKEYLLTHDAGSGPYMVKEFPLEEYLLMEKYDSWHGTFAADAPDEVRFIATTEAATVRTLMSRQELEITEHSVSDFSQLVIAGHDHNYERTKPQNGVTYLVTGGAGRGTRSVGESSFTAFAERVAHFTYFVLEGDELTLYAIDASGEVFDTARLVAQP